MNRRLIVFARLPRHGRVKTRLAATVGADLALAAHRALLERTLRVAEACAVTRRVWAHPPDDERPGPADGLPAAGWLVQVQRGADLGERMRNAIEEALGAGELPVLVGADCPVLEPSDVADAYAALSTHDAAFAPTEDGGYALVGLARPLPTLFERMPWGTAHVADETRTRLAAAGARAAWLRTLWDVDREADLRRWQAYDPARAPSPRR